jgi:hypothetical protein
VSPAIGKEAAEMRTYSRTRRLMAVVLLAWFQPACTTFQTTDLAPQEALEGQEQAILTVADSAGERIIHLANPWVTADSIGGTPCDQHFTCSAGSTLSVPLSSVQRLEVKRYDKKATMLLGGVVLAAALVVFMAALNSSLEEAWGSSQP